MESLGKYKIVQELGHGGMGVVYLARDTVIGRDVAIKIIQEHAMQMPEIRDRLHREARSAGRLTHENIMTLYDFGQEGDRSYLVMELLDGIDLSQVITEGQPMSLPRKLEIALQICKGMHYAHSRSVIHRDIKPGNIRLLASGRVKIVDFGIARLGSEPGTLTHSSMGTPRYMSPEQIRGEPIDARTDVFSFGVLFYELLTGANPFPGENVYSEIYKVLNVEAEPLDLEDSVLNADLQRIVSRCIAKDQDQRCESFEVLIGEIEALIEQCRSTETNVGALVDPATNVEAERDGAATVVDPAPGEAATIVGPGPGDAATIVGPGPGDAATIVGPGPGDAATIVGSGQNDGATIVASEADEAATILHAEPDEAATILHADVGKAATIMHTDAGEAATVLHTTSDAATPSQTAGSADVSTEDSAPPAAAPPASSVAAPKTRSRRPLWLGSGLAVAIVAVIGFVWMSRQDDLQLAGRDESIEEAGPARSVSDVARLDAQPDLSAPEMTPPAQEDVAVEDVDEPLGAGDDPVEVEAPRLATPSLNVTRQPSPEPAQPVELQGEDLAARELARRNEAARSKAATTETAMDAARGPLAAYADDDCARAQFSRGEEHRLRGHELYGSGDFQGAATAFAAAETEFDGLARAMAGRDQAVRARDGMNMARYRISDPSVRAVSEEYRNAESLRDRGETEFSACNFASAARAFGEAEALYKRVESLDQPSPEPTSRPVADVVQEQADRLLALLETAMVQGDWSAIPAPVSTYYKRQFDRLRNKHDILEVSVERERPQVAGSAATLPVIVDITHQQKGTDNVNVISIRKSWSWEVTDNRATVAALLDP